jgi:hypothetical protein
LFVDLKHPATFNLFSTDGRMVLSGRLQAGRTELDLEALPNGLYILRIDGEGASVARLVKGARP